MVIFIILTFGLSSIAFVVVNFTGNKQDEQLKPLASYVVSGRVDERLENAYLRAGFTIVRHYYTQAPDLYVKQLPQLFQTNSGQTQIIVEEIQGSEDKLEIVNTNTLETLTDLSQPAIFAKLCDTLLFTPVECGLANLTS